MAKKLRLRQRKFIAEYLKNPNGTQAAIKAGYSPHTANEIASENLTKPSIRAEIEKATRKLGIDPEYILGGFKKVADRCMTAEPVMEFDHEGKEMVEKKTWIEDPDNPGKTKIVGVYEFDSMGANKALENLAKATRIISNDKVGGGLMDGVDLIGLLIVSRGERGLEAQG